MFLICFSYICIELDQEEERASMDDGSIDYYFNDIFDYNDDARAGAIKSNTFKTLDGWDLHLYLLLFQFIFNFLHRLQRCTTRKIFNRKQL